MCVKVSVCVCVCVLQIFRDAIHKKSGEIPEVHARDTGRNVRDIL